MATLNTVDGRTLVPDLGPALQNILQIGQTLASKKLAQEKKEGIQEQVDDLTQVGVTPAEREKAFLNIAALDPVVAQAMRQIRTSGNKEAEAQLNRDAEEGLRDAVIIRKQKTFEGKKAALRDILAKRHADGKDIQKGLEMHNLETEEEFDTALTRMEVMGTDIKTLTTPKEQFTPVKDADGNVVAQKSTTTGKIIADPRVAKPTEPKAAFKPVLDDKGNVVAQKNTVTGEIKADPRVAKPAAAKGKFEPVLDDQGKVVGQKNTLTGEIKSDPRTIKDTTLIQTLRSIGVDPDTTEGAALVKKILTTAETKVEINKENAGLFKTPNGFMLTDPEDPAKGVTPIPGGPKDTVTGENAGKAQMLRTAQKGAKGIRALVFNEKGEIDKVNLVNASLGTPGTKGRELKQKMEFGIQAITRIETGAAMPDSELDNTRARFMPAPFDSPAIVNLKLDMFDDFIGGTLKLLDPSGRFNAERFQSELETRAEDEGVSLETEAKKEPGTVGRFKVRVK